MSQGPYHLISIAILLVLSYLISLLGVRLQIFSVLKHRRFWNSLLLFFFICASLLGLFLAIRVNYKLDIGWVDQALQWHVDLGIALAFVAIFHLTWHLGYYWKIASGKRYVTEEPVALSHLDINALQVKLLFILLGFISMIAQLVLMREFIKSFRGNELIIGVFLALWMILTAAGAWAGTKYRARILFRSILFVILFLGTLPLLIYAALILVTRYLFLPGYEPGFFPTIFITLLIITPFTLISGFMFSYISRSVKGERVDASYYMLDSLGSLAGGAFFGLFLVFFLDNLQVLALLFLMTISAIILIFRFPAGIIWKTGLWTTGIILFGAILFPASRKAIEAVRFQGEEILGTRDTPYGNLTFTERDGQVNGYMDGIPAIHSFDPVLAEESVHYAALQLSDPDSFLLIGGSFSGNRAEIQKYEPEVFDYCEANPWFYRMGRKHLPVDTTGAFRFIDDDGRSWLMSANDRRYDVIISIVGDPLTIGLNRYYTLEFYSVVASRLRDNGVFCTRLSTGGNYISTEGNEVLSINYSTLMEIFDHVLVIPGNATYFLASNQPLSLDFPVLMEGRPFINRYVNSDYLDVMQLTFHSDQLLEQIKEPDVAINRDLWPLLFFRSISSWKSRTGEAGMGVTAILAILVSITLLMLYPPLKSGMYAAGFTGAGIQILLILVVQSLYGFTYLITPLLITLFMGGLVTGTRIWRSIWRTSSISKYTALIWIMAILSAAGVVILKSDQLQSYRVAGQIILGLLNFLPGMIVGSVYGMALDLEAQKGKSGIGRFYSADLAGASLGTFISPIFILPLIGVTNTFILFCGINVATGLYILSRWHVR